MTQSQIALECRDVSKRFPPATVALDHVSLVLDAGSIHGLLGVNGAGKSTLIKILAGVERPEGGSLLVGDRSVDFPGSPQEAHALGVGVVHQELPLLPNLTAAENVFLGVQSPRFLARSHRRQIRTRYEEVAAKLSGAPPADRKLAELGPDRWQVVAVIRALAAGARILILDEPTSSLGQNERRALHRALRDVAALGVPVLYVSHFLDDVLDVCDVVTVLRDARVSMESRTDGLTTPALLGAMTGERVARPRGRRTEVPGGENGEQPVFELRELATSTAGPVSLTVRRGERVGFYGLQDCGARELLEASFGLRRHRGECALDGHPLRGGTRRRIDAGLGYMPPERSKALVPNWSVGANLTLPNLGSRPSGAPVRRRAERIAGADLVDRFGIVGRVSDPVWTLSGGNQQKVALAKWLGRDVDCLLADEPTRGVDVRGRQRLYDLIVRHSERGAATLLFSTDPEEIVALCHRVVVLERGHPRQILEGSEITVDELERVGRVRELVASAEEGAE